MPHIEPISFSEMVPVREDDELDILLDGYVSVRNVFYPPAACHPNTRSTVLDNIEEWLDKSRLERLLWIYGPAGAGKSAIATTIAASHDSIVATFSFTSSSDRSASALFPTLAWQLARNIPEIRKHIIASLKNIGSLQSTRIEEQFDILILQPLKSATTLVSRPVIIIDGLDECVDESMVARFLQVLLRPGEHSSMPVRFIICSRPELRIRAIPGRAHDVNPTANEEGLQFPSLPEKPPYFVCAPSPQYPSRTELRLHTPPQWIRGVMAFLQDILELYRPIRFDVDKHAPSTVDARDELADAICPHPMITTIKIGLSEEDVARYLTDIFNLRYYTGDGTKPQFQPRDISDLVEASCGQFLYASTLVRLLDEPQFDPRDAFEMVARRNSLPTPDLNDLYKAILKRAQDTIRNETHKSGLDCETELGFLMDSLTALVFLAGNIHFFTVLKSFPLIESLLGLESGQLTKTLSKMHSVLRIVPGESVQVHHRSFLDFLQNRERSGEYYISSSAAFRRVLMLMSRAGVRYSIFHDNDRGKRYIEDMTVACRRNFFERSRFSNVLDLFHHLIHLLVIIPLLLLRTHIPLPLSIPPVCQLTMRFFLCFFGTFIVSSTTYTFFFDHSIIVPFFHPFLHPFFFVTGGFLVPSRLLCFVALLLFEVLALLS